MFEAFVLICLWGQPQEPKFCEELRDTRGPYKTKIECENRVIEIALDMPNYRPEMQPRGYSCSSYTPVKDNNK